MDYLTEYNSEWPAWFRQIEQSFLRKIPHFLRIEHVGSTSIPGMVAKPIIDLDVVVPDGTIADAIASVEQAGYAHQGTLGIVGREAFRLVGDAPKRLPKHHLYACELSSPELHRHTAFREYLRAHPAEVSRLSAFKRTLAFQQHLSRDEYMEAKSPLVIEMLAQALAWYGTQEGKNAGAD